MLPLTVFKDKSVTTLSHGEFRVLVAYAAEFNGGNNGSLALTRSQAAALGIGHKLLQSAQRTLESRGLICRTRQGTRTPPKPNAYALAWLGIDEGNHDARPNPAPSMEFLKWSPPVTSVSGDSSGVTAHDSSGVTGPSETASAVTPQESRSGVFDDSSGVTSKNLPRAKRFAGMGFNGSWRAENLRERHR